ncbi:MAG: translation elongation factor Ts [Spirochaetales bacterium]
MEIKASDVKALREVTGAGMMECKNALVECKGDAESAAKLLKEKGLAAVEKRSGRSTKEGRIFIKIADNKVAMAELTCETDFVAKNPDFSVVGQSILDEVFANNYNEVNDTLSNLLLDLATKIRENMSVRRVCCVEIPANSVVSSYIHSDGKIGVVTILSSDPSMENNEEAKQFAYDCCLHIAAFTPLYITRDEVDSAYIAEQKEIFAAQIADLDKPDNVKEGIVEGKINKHLAEICFMEQQFVKGDKISVAKKMEEVGKAVGSKIALEKVICYQLGM